ncbi:MAG: hypothetical protein QXF12_00815 [Candidatus Aenigmatarchaeota archaeon]
MARLNRIVKLEALKASIEENRPVVSYVDFQDTDGKVCEYTFNGRFNLPEYKLAAYDKTRKANLLDILKKDIPLDLFAHYARIWDKILSVFASGIDATDCKTITFGFIYNPDKSLDTPDIVYNGDPFVDYPVVLDEKVFYLSPIGYVFYDFIIKKDNQVVAKVKGVPHFALPSLLEFLGKYLGHAKENVVERDLQAV